MIKFSFRSTFPNFAMHFIVHQTYSLFQSVKNKKNTTVVLFKFSTSPQKQILLLLKQSMKNYWKHLERHVQSYTRKMLTKSSLVKLAE